MFWEFVIFCSFVIGIFGYSARKDGGYAYYLFSAAFAGTGIVFFPEKSEIPQTAVLVLFGVSFLFGFFFPKKFFLWIISNFGEKPDGDED